MSLGRGKIINYNKQKNSMPMKVMENKIINKRKNTKIRK